MKKYPNQRKKVMTIILKNENNQIVAQFPKESFERFYIGRDEQGFPNLNIVHVDGTCTVLSDRHGHMNTTALAQSLAEQLAQTTVVDEFNKLKDKVSEKMETAKTNVQVIASVASIYKNVMLSKLFSSKEKTKPVASAEPEIKEAESKTETVSVDASMEELFNKLESVISSMTKPKEVAATDNDVIKEINDLFMAGELTYTKLYGLIGTVREDVRRKKSTSPELNIDEVVTILRMNNLL